MPTTSMSNRSAVSRRGFLKVSVAVTGGLFVSLHLDWPVLLGNPRSRRSILRMPSFTFGLMARS